MPSEGRITLTSPDGRLRLEHHTDWDDRSGSWVWLRLVALPEGEVLVSLSSLVALDDIRFVPGGVQFTATPWRGPAQRVVVDARSRTFQLHPHLPAAPLGELSAALEPPALPSGLAVFQPPAPRTLRARLFDAGNVLLGLVFVAGGAWMALDAEKASERWTGAFAVLFFGACTALPLWEAWQRRRGKAPPEAPER